MELEINTFLRPNLNFEHSYSVGLRIEGGGFAPLVSYKTRDELEKGFLDFYNFAVERNLSNPIAVEKKNDSEWDNEAQCFILSDLMREVIKRLQN